MKKMWIYLAVPMALLNGCQRQQALLDDAESLTAQVEENPGEAPDGLEAPERPDMEPDTETAGEEPDGLEARERSDAEPAGEQPEGRQPQFQVSAEALAGVILGQNFIKEAPFGGSTVAIARSGEREASRITAEEIEAMVREAAFDLEGGVYNFGAPGTKSMFDMVHSLFERLGWGTERLARDGEAYAEGPRDLTMSQEKLNGSGIFFTNTEERLLRILELQAQGGKRMTAAAYLLGHPIQC